MSTNVGESGRDRGKGGHAPADRALVWFRADLRVEDNAALSAACDSHQQVFGVFLIADEQWREHDWASVKVEFILDHLRELSAKLGKLNIPLLIEQAPWFADAPRVLADLVTRHGIAAVYANDEYEVNERGRDATVESQLAKLGVGFKRFTDQTLIEPGTLRTGEGRFYTVFSPFKRALYKALEAQGSVELFPTPTKRSATGIASSPVPERVEGFTSHVPIARLRELWPAGETAALARLNHFIDTQITTYKLRRDVPSIDATSKLSPYLTAGSISHRQCVRAAMSANGQKLDKGNEGAVHWISEVAWREFYRHILVGFPRVCMGRAFKPETDRLVWSSKREHFERWCEGRTGVPIVDAGIRQMLATGWMHNRVRMITAMYLTKDLFINWRWGERFFMQHLIDGDLASNNGGWQWSASTGTDAAPYFRIFNPISQSRRFDPDGAYIRTYVPELKDLEGGEDGAIHDPSTVPALLRGTLAYPEPMVERAGVAERVTKAFQELKA